MPGFLYQIENKQKKAIEERTKTQGPRLLASLRVAHRRAKERYVEDKVKVVGVDVPTSIYERMEKFLAKHEGDKTMPQSKKALALACILKFLDDDAVRNPTDLPTIDEPVNSTGLPTIDEPVNPV